MTPARVFAAWTVVVAAIVGLSGIMVYSDGILLRHGPAPSEVLYGWDAVRYLCPRIAAGAVAFTALAGVVVWILGGGRR